MSEEEKVGDTLTGQAPEQGEPIHKNKQNPPAKVERMADVEPEPPHPDPTHRPRLTSNKAIGE